jgi:hypothetical protein
MLWFVLQGWLDVVHIYFLSLAAHTSDIHSSGNTFHNSCHPTTAFDPGQHCCN